MPTSEIPGTLKIFLGCNGYYVALESAIGTHHMPADSGAEIGHNFESAQRLLDLLQADPDSYPEKWLYLPCEHCGGWIGDSCNCTD